MSQQQGHSQPVQGHQVQSPQPVGGAGVPVSGTGPQSLQSMPQQRQQIRSVALEEIVQSDVEVAERDTPVSSAVEQMKSEDVGSIIAVDNDQKPIGIVTDRKIALALEETPDIGQREVSELLQDEVITGSADMSVFDAINQLNENSIRRLPIVDDDGTLEGIVTLDDLLVLLATELNTAAEIIKNQSPRL